ncbi:hypothetical protein [Microbacterium sp. 3J1]|uniref:hypothetical protein n=1 Tax=Microbacterium sp. 3J1 TaxID=861269 RepID=UPI000B169EC6|nr:hypothetical protein [Microbacterium sp. 3J1]
MSGLQPNHGSDGANQIAEAIRREARKSRVSQARYAQLVFDRYGWEPVRIAEALEVTTDLVVRLLAADGVVRCVECCFNLHGSCMGELNFDLEGMSAPCGCGCRHADRESEC